MQWDHPLVSRGSSRILTGLAVFLSLVQLDPGVHGQSPEIRTEGAPEPSIGADAGRPERTSLPVSLRRVTPPQEASGAAPLSVDVQKGFEGFGFDDNPVENINPATGRGVRFIPPDPIGAAGHSRVIAVVNSMIEARTKGGHLKWRQGLRDFFAPLSLASFPFDPKIVYDQFEDRFVVVALEQITGTASVSPTNVSRILLAVSKDGNPKGPADWHFRAIDSKVVIPRPVTPFDHWADYPGFEVDEEAVYVTANMFTFVPFGSFGGVRLWIVHKGAGTGGFYDGGTATVTRHDPYAAAGIATTTMPAQVHGDGGAGPGIGTYLVSYSGLSDGLDEFVQVVRVDNPLTAPVFSHQFVNVGNIENFMPVPLPDAPQPGVDVSGVPRLIEVNDRRALDAVWRDDGLWMVAEINPLAGPDAGQTTAHWLRLDTTVPATIAVDQQGNIGGEDLAPGTFTYYPAVAVNRDGDAMFGFSASAPTMFAGAFVAGRQVGDPPSTVQPAETVHAGEDFYFRSFSGANNRWGDYSGISVDPSNDMSFWVFNEFADQRGTISPFFPDQDGRWGTAWGRSKFKH
jgi:hypothetical protein